MLIILLAVAINAMPVSLVMPMLRPMGAEYGASAFEVSILFSLMPLVGVIGNPLWGRVSDKLGRRVAMTMTLGGTALAFLAFAFADSLWLLFATRALQGVFHGSNSIALAYIADTTKPQDRAKEMGKVFGSMGAGLAIGPTLGGLLMGNTAETFSHVLPCLAAAALSVAAAATIFFFLKETKKAEAPATPGKPKPKLDISAILRNPALWVLVAMIFCGGFKFNSEQFAYQYWGAAVGWSPRNVSFGLAVLSIGFLVTSFALVGFFTTRFGDEKSLLMAAGADFALMLIFIALSGSEYAFGLLFITAFCSPLWGTVLASVLSRQAPPGFQGVIQGASTSVQLAGRIVGTLIAGALTERFGFVAVYVMLSVLMVFIVSQSARFVIAKNRAASTQPAH